MSLMCRNIDVQSLTTPFLDESLIANLDKIISMFQKNDENQFTSKEDLKKTLDDLKTVKSTLKLINNQLFDEMSSSLKAPIFTEQFAIDEKVKTPPEKTSNEAVTRSSDILNNSEAFTQLVDKKNSPKKQSVTNDDFGKRSSKEYVKEISARPTWSLTSIRNSMTVSPPCSFNNRKSSNSKRITRKVSRHVLVRKADKKMRDSQKVSSRETSEPLMTEENASFDDEPNITSTHYATCRIHCYEDKSHTFEIIKPSRVNCYGDGNEKSDIVIVVLANGQTALFTSKSSGSFMNILSPGESK